MKKLLALAMAIVMATTTMSVSAADTYDFVDMPAADHWATTSLEAAVDNGLLQGNDGEISPEADLTRAEMATIMVRAFGGETEADLDGFSDMSSSAWYYDEMAKAVGMKIFQGDGTSLSPNSSITRQEAFAVLARAFVLDEADSEEIEDYLDYSSVSDWAVPEVAAMVASGYVQGSGGYLNPLDTITRQEFAVIMDRMVETYVTEDGEYSEFLDGSVMIDVPDVTLSDVTIEGNLYIGDGVGDGDITLDNVEITGSLIVRGGGVNSVIITGGTSVGGTLKIAKVDGEVRVAIEDDADVEVIYVADGLDDITVEGTFDTLIVDYNSIVYAVNTEITNIDILHEEGIVILGNSTVTGDITIHETATDAQVIIYEDATVESIVVKAEGASVEIADDAVVDYVSVEADSVTVEGDGTIKDIDVSDDVAGTVVDGDDVDAGTSTDLNVSTSSSSSSSSSYSTRYTVTLTLTEVTDSSNTQTMTNVDVLGNTTLGTTTVGTVISSMITTEMGGDSLANLDDSTNFLNVLNTNAFNAILKEKMPLAVVSSNWESMTINNDTVNDTATFYMNINDSYLFDESDDTDDIEISIVADSGVLSAVKSGTQLRYFTASTSMTITIDGTDYTLEFTRS